MKLPSQDRNAACNISLNRFHGHLLFRQNSVCNVRPHVTIIIIVSRIQIGVYFLAG